MRAPTDFPTVEELERHTRALAQDARVAIRLLGASRTGRAIELISLGDGARSALLVGAPHPNEPVGCASIELMIDRLLREPELGAGYRWHFIKAIDIDGLALNEGWFKGPRALALHARHFFRPAFRRQPEYAFPLRTATYSFNAPTTETRCWQKALDLTRPDLQVSLHGSDYGGAFFLTSDEIPALTEALQGIVGRTDIGINTIGDTGYWEKAYAPGFFPLPGLDEPGKLPDGWAAGNSSAGYAKPRYGTFSLMPEVPLWTSRTLFDDSLSPFSLDDIGALGAKLNATIAEALARDLPVLARHSPTGDAHELQLALEQALGAASKGVIAVEENNPMKEPPRRLSWREYAQRGAKLRVIMLRPFSMLRRLAGMTGERAVAERSWAYMESELVSLERETAFEPVPTQVIANLQVEAALAAAKVVAGR